MKVMARFYNHDSYMGLSLNNAERNLIEKRVVACHSVLANAMHHYSRILHQHHVLKVPADYNNQFEDGELIGRFFKKLTKLWDRKKRGKLYYAWCKEVEKGKNCHIHLHTMCSEKLNRSGCTRKGGDGELIFDGVNGIINRAWQSALTPNIYTQGLVHDAGEKKIHRDELVRIDESMHWISYICKQRKGTQNHGFRTSKVDKTIEIPIVNATADNNME